MKHYTLQKGFSLVELMIATTLGLMISYALLQIYLAQDQLYKTSNSQALILNTQNAIASLLTPVFRGAGFLGCGSISTAYSNLTTGLPEPLGSLNTNPTMIRGYNGSNSNFNLTQINAGNSTNVGDWSPSLPTSLLGQVEKGSDVVVVLGAIPGFHPIGVTQIDSGSNSISLQDTTDLSVNQLGSVSDCVKSILFVLTGVSTNSITHNVGSGSMQNASSTFPVNFEVGAQFIPLQQTAFFVGQGQGGQSSLMRGILNGSNWTIEPIAPGVEFMKVQYGIGSSGSATQYISANSVTDWSQVYAIRLGFLLAGKTGSSSTKTSYTVLDTTVTVPADNILRHTFEMTIQLRNAQ